jgi:hypothetical protein
MQHDLGFTAGRGWGRIRMEDMRFLQASIHSEPA